MVETYLGLPISLLRSIVSIVDETGETTSLCSGVFVAPNWVVTAAHCLAIRNAAVQIAANELSPRSTYRVTEARRHPDRDVALLRTALPLHDAAAAALPLHDAAAAALPLHDAAAAALPLHDAAAAALPLHDAAAASISPIATARVNQPELSAGSIVEVAGYGLTAREPPGTLRFLVETVVRIDEAEITLDGFGESGACVGDSGGPLLVRAPDGQVVVAAVLGAGSASCVGRDRYVRLDVMNDWIRDIIGTTDAGGQECGAIPSGGRCLYGTALWCEDGRLAAEPCGLSMRCGWDASRRGFRCVEPSIDPCAGVDALGACMGNMAQQCVEGTLTTTACDDCETCRVDPMTGRPACVRGSSRDIPNGD